MIKAVLFDLDGTVINTNELVIASWKHAFKIHLGRCPEDSEIIKTFGEPLIQTARRYDSDNAEEICNTYRKYNLSVHDDMIKGYEGMEDTIRQLKSLGLKVGIVTSKLRHTAERALKIFGLYDLMDIIVTMEDTNEHKPKAGPLLKAVEILGIMPVEVLYVGDTHFDILCSKNAGAKACAVKYSMVPTDELVKYMPEFMVDKPLEIVDIVKENIMDKLA